MALPPRGAAALGLWQIARAAGLMPHVESGQAGRP
jgi:2-dehydro-3-deoxygalactonokinase